MNVKKYSRLKPFLLFIVILAGIVLAVVLFNILTRSETTGPVTTTSMISPFNSPNENWSLNVWAKTLKTSSGFSLLKSDSYNVLSVSVYSPGSWNSVLNEWSIYILIAGFGATRSGYGLIQANGWKTVWFGVDHGNDSHTYGHYTSFGFNSSRNDFMVILPVAVNSSGIVPAPAFSSKAIEESVDHQTSFGWSYRGGDVWYYTPINRWQYSDLLAGDKNDAIFVALGRTEFEPGRTIDVIYSSTFTWGLLDSSRNGIHFNFTLPPDPNTLTPQQLEQNGISTYTYQDNGQNKTGYRLYRINCTGE